MKDRSDDPSHHEQTLLPRSYISFPLMKGIDNGNCIFYQGSNSGDANVLIFIFISGIQCFNNLFLSGIQHTSVDDR